VRPSRCQPLGISTENTAAWMPPIATLLGGTFSRGELDPGAYDIRIESPAHLVRVVERTLAAREQAQLDATLMVRPPSSGIAVQGSTIRAPALRFAAGATDLDAAAALALAELADTLHREPTIAHVRLQVGGDAAVANARAETLRQRLAANGIEPARAEVAADASGDRVSITIAP